MNDSNLLNGGQVIIDYLIREKVPYVFGLCGHGNIGLIDAMHERADEIATISVFLPKKSIFFLIFLYSSKLNIVICCNFTTPFKKVTNFLCFFCTFIKFLINTNTNERKVFH